MPLQLLQQRALSLFEAGRSVHDGWPDASGEVAALAQALRHVGAERAHLESFTNELLGRLRSVMEAAPLGIGFTRNQRFELINPAWCRMLQLEDAELLGHHASIIFANTADYEALGPAVLRWAIGLSFLAMAPFVIPGIVMAIGFYAAYAGPPLSLYGTATLIILAFTARFLPKSAVATAVASSWNMQNS